MTVNVNLKPKRDKQLVASLLIFVPGIIFGISILLVDRLLDPYFITQPTAYFNTSYRPLLPIIAVATFLLFLYICRDELVDSHLRPVDSIVISLASGGIIGGALANIFDFNMYNGVLDYWSLPYLSSIHFNLADVSIVLGLVIWGAKFFQNKRFSSTR